MTHPLTKAAFILNKIHIIKIQDMYSWHDGKAEFSTSSLQSSVTWSFRIILICWFGAQETFLIIINFQKSLKYCVKQIRGFFFFFRILC